MTQELEIDRICVRFEGALRSGAQPLIEQFLDTVNEPSRPHLLRQLLLLELEHEKGLGNEADVAEYLKRFPTNRSIVFSAFAEHARPEGPAETEVRGPDPKRPVGAESESSPSDSSHHGRFLPGTKLAGRHRIVSLLGKGGMGEVYRADDLHLGQTVALKFLPKHLADDAKRLEYFRTEVRLSRQVSHPNVCRVYDIGEVDGQHFLSMEYIDGEDLKGLLRRVGRFPKERGTEIARQLCAGLAAAHDKGVLHRDLKPANVMIDGRGHVRITDFGLATAAEERDGSESLVGTPAYMAPEQLQRAETSVQSDIYSLGLVLYEVFTGQPAHKSRPPSRGDWEHEDSSSPSHPSDLVDDMDPSVDRIVMRCLEGDPQARPRSVAEVAASLPGGDPLAAALAAGETPSPALVAAAGTEGVLPTAIGGLCLAGVAAGLIVYVLLSQRGHLVNRMPLKIKPANLEYIAQEIIRDLGYTDESAQSAVGFTADKREVEYVQQSSLTRPGQDRWQLLRTGPWPGIRFWYRQIPRTRRAPWSSIFGVDIWGNIFGRTIQDLPPWTEPGMVGVELDPRGPLRRFRAVPPVTAPVTAPAPRDLSTSHIPWTKWFNEDRLGFRIEDLKPSSLQRTPPDAYDAARSWEGTWPGTDEPLYVEAAAYRGRPVYFEVLRSADVERTASDQSDFDLLYLIAVEVGAIVLAWRNLRLGRGDRRGALRIAGYWFCLAMTYYALPINGISCFTDHALFRLAVAHAAGHALMLWVFYLALEPLVRRYWPELLITWTRLCEGRVRDPAVGRDLLLGALVGIVVAVLGAAACWTTESGPPHHYWSVGSLVGPYSLVAHIISRHQIGIDWGLSGAITLVFLWLLVRRKLLAGAGLVVLHLCFGPQQISFPSVVLPGLVATCVAVWLTIRFGILALVVQVSVSFLLGLPITIDTSAFYFSHGVFVVGFVLAIALYGFYTSSDEKKRHPIVSAGGADGHRRTG